MLFQNNMDEDVTLLFRVKRINKKAAKLTQHRKNFRKSKSRVDQKTQNEMVASSASYK